MPTLLSRVEQLHVGRAIEYDLDRVVLPGVNFVVKIFHAMIPESRHASALVEEMLTEERQAHKLRFEFTRGR